MLELNGWKLLGRHAPTPTGFYIELVSPNSDQFCGVKYLKKKHRYRLYGVVFRYVPKEIRQWIRDQHNVFLLRAKFLQKEYPE